MNYTQIHRPAMKLVGIGVETAVGKTQIDCPKVWGDFMARFAEVGKAVGGLTTYGVSVSTNNEACTMRYVASVEVSDVSELPAGMEAVDVPESDYLVFTHKGKLDTLGKTYAEAMEELKKLDKKQGDVWLELYDGRYKVDSEESEFVILVPVK